MRQKKPASSVLDRLANAVIWRRPFLALWKAGHEPIQLIFDFFPIPIGHRCLCAVSCLTADYLSSTAALPIIELVVNNRILGRSAHARWRAFMPASLIRNSSILRPDLTAATSHLGRLPRPTRLLDTETSRPEFQPGRPCELHPASKLCGQRRGSPGCGPDGRQGSVGVACAAPPCAAPRLCGEGKVTMTSISLRTRCRSSIWALSWRTSHDVVGGTMQRPTAS